MDDNIIVDMLYAELGIVKEDYDIANMETYAVKDKDGKVYVMTTVYYYRDNKLYKRVYRHCLQDGTK